MRIIVVGCGKIGTTIVASLVAEGHDVVAVDHDPAVIDELTNVYDVMGVCGNGADCEALSEAGVEKAELVVAVTDSDERNMLSCFIARRMGAKHTIARIRTPGYNDQSLGFLRQHLDLSTSINPELMAAKELFHLLKLPSAIDVETFSHGNFEMVELVIKPESPLDGLSLILDRLSLPLDRLLGAGITLGTCPAGGEGLSSVSPTSRRVVPRTGLELTHACAGSVAIHGALRILPRSERDVAGAGGPVLHPVGHY